MKVIKTGKQGKLDIREIEDLILSGDAKKALQLLPDESAQCCITSPPYWGLRDYEAVGQVGAEQKLEDYINNLTGIFNEIKRVLKPDGTFWLNIGDSYTSGRSR